MNYTVSFGASDKYSVHYSGNLEQFKNSDELHRIKEAIYGYVKERFPGVNYEYVLPLHVEEYDPAVKDFPGLDCPNFSLLKKDVARQMEIKMQDKELNDTAPFSATGAKGMC